MPSDTPRAHVEFFEDFIGQDVVADKPEYAVDTDPAVEIAATEPGGVVRITMDAGQSNIGGIGFGHTQWDISQGIYFEARVRLSAIGTAAERVFVGFTDLQEDTLSEFPFTISGMTLTAVADPNDAVGFVWEGDATSPAWFPASQNTDVLVVDGTTNVAATKRKPPVAATWQTLSFYIAPGGKFAEFAVDGEVVLVYSSATTPVVADVPLYPVFVATEGTTAINAELDYMYIRANRLA